jgi:hypothetical protein
LTAFGVQDNAYCLPGILLVLNIRHSGIRI